LNVNVLTRQEIKTSGKTVLKSVSYVMVFHFILQIAYKNVTSCITRYSPRQSGSRGSSVSIVSSYGRRPGYRRSTPGRGKIIFSSSLCVQTGSGAHPASCTMGTGGPFPEVKARPGRDEDHSPHLVPRSRMSTSYTSSPPCASTGVMWDGFTITR
jgi:hypothetical protein